MKKLFIESKPERVLTLTGDDHLHVSVVLRAKQGDRIVLCCGDGYDYVYEIVGFERNKTTLSLVDKTESSSEPNCKVDLFIAFTKGDKLEFITQKCTELGINSIRPFVSEYVQVKGEIRLDRLNKIAKEAAQQCGRGKVPNVMRAVSFSEMLDELDGYRTALFFYEGGGDKGIEPKGDTAIVIGCEGGFSETEARLLAQKASVVSLGKRILRAETAAIAATALTMYKLGELQ